MKKKNIRAPLFCLISLTLFLISNIYPLKHYESIITLKSQKVPELEERVNIDAYIKSWISKSSEKLSPIYLIAGQGGGSRAGFWTANILDSLSHIKDLNFIKNCLAISTVSGSSLGVNLFLEAKKNNVRLDSTKIAEFYGHDFVSRSAANLFFVNPFHKLLSIPIEDKNRILITEEAKQLSKSLLPNIENYESTMIYKDYLINVLSGIDSTELESPNIHDLPLVFYNTYNISTKKKSVISEVMLYGDNLKDQYEDFLTPLHKDKESITKGQAVNLSQMFPLMSTSNILENSSQYFDGGVYDNSGLSTIHDIYEILNPIRDELAPSRKIVILYLKNSNEIIEKKVARSATGALIKAGSGSIFSASPRKYIENLRTEVEANGDVLFDSIFVNKDSITLNRWLSVTQMNDLTQGVNTSFEKFDKEVVPNLKPKDLLPKKHLIQVYFNTKSSELKPSQLKKIDTELNGVIPYKFNLDGFSDIQNDLGTNNAELAQNRVDNVCFYLRNKYKNASCECGKLNVGGGDKGRLSMQNNRRVDIRYSFYEYESKEYYFNKKSNKRHN